MISYFSERCLDKMNQQKLSVGALFGGIYGNLRCAAGIKSRHPKDKETIKELVSIAADLSKEMRLRAPETIVLESYLKSNLEKL
jgi:hypothetical protein